MYNTQVSGYIRFFKSLRHSINQSQQLHCLASLLLWSRYFFSWKKRNIYKAHKYYQAGGRAEQLLKYSPLHYTCSVLEGSTCEKNSKLGWPNSWMFDMSLAPGSQHCYSWFIVVLEASCFWDQTKPKQKITFSQLNFSRICWNKINRFLCRSVDLSAVQYSDVDSNLNNKNALADLHFLC